MTTDAQAELERRVLYLERKIAEMDVEAVSQRSKMESDMKDNTEMTAAVKLTADQVKKDTAEIVDLLKGLKVFGSIAKWVLGLASVIGIILGISKAGEIW